METSAYFCVFFDLLCVASRYRTLKMFSGKISRFRREIRDPTSVNSHALWYARLFQYGRYHYACTPLASASEIPPSTDDTECRRCALRRRWVSSWASPCTFQRTTRSGSVSSVANSYSPPSRVPGSRWASPASSTYAPWRYRCAWRVCRVSARSFCLVLFRCCANRRSYASRCCWACCRMV
jgi:hypothetical protein